MKGATRGEAPPMSSVSAASSEARSSSSVSPPRAAARNSPSGFSARRAWTMAPGVSLVRCSDSGETTRSTQSAPIGSASSSPTTRRARLVAEERRDRVRRARASPTCPPAASACRHLAGVSGEIDADRESPLDQRQALGEFLARPRFRRNRAPPASGIDAHGGGGARREGARSKMSARRLDRTASSTLVVEVDRRSIRHPLGRPLPRCGVSSGGKRRQRNHVAELTARAYRQDRGAAAMRCGSGGGWDC